MEESGSQAAAPPSRRLIVLGSGTSTGVPVLGCDCPVCRSDDPRNARTRPSVLLRLPAGDLLIDTTPELRLQLLRQRVAGAHAILYTHAHADHLFGLDDARLFPKVTGGPVPIYCEQEVEEAIRRAFSYAFDERVRRLPSGGVPQVEFRRIAPGEPFEVLGERITPMRLEHGRFRVLGFRLGGLAYCTDVSKIPEESWPMLEGLETLLIDALRPEPHPTHFSLDEALEVIARLRPRRAYLTHLSHFYDHGPVEARLPPGVFLAYDGLTIAF
ncbi:MBL fold metallo-hydrolase [Tautonia sociabilis]|uniref:MBL fold metallo-hydrolase n=1 Tax=Tautonia sociabilis TaxID=2080755 RepID=UPI0018F326FF|nr:MBL fold metallo-hydrolase [Tautonia sociabilis]